MGGLLIVYLRASNICSVCGFLVKIGSLFPGINSHGSQATQATSSLFTVGELCTGNGFPLLPVISPPQEIQVTFPKRKPNAAFPLASLFLTCSWWTWYTFWPRQCFSTSCHLGFPHHRKFRSLPPQRKPDKRVMPSSLLIHFLQLLDFVHICHPAY